MFKRKCKEKILRRITLDYKQSHFIENIDLKFQSKNNQFNSVPSNPVTGTIPDQTFKYLIITMKSYSLPNNMNFKAFSN